MKKSILVLGATGAQGGSVARHLLKENNFDVKFVTCDLTLVAAKYLEDLGENKEKFNQFF